MSQKSADFYLLRIISLIVWTYNSLKDTVDGQDTKPY